MFPGEETALVATKVIILSCVRLKLGNYYGDNRRNFVICLSKMTLNFQIYDRALYHNLVSGFLKYLIIFIDTK